MKKTPNRTSGSSSSAAGRFVKRKTRKRRENSRNYLDQLLLRELDCKHHSIKLNRKHTFTGFNPTKLYEFPGIEAVKMLAVSDELLYVLGRHGSVVAINRENPERLYKVRQQFSNYKGGQIYYDEKTDCLISYTEWWCEPAAVEEDDEEDHVPILGAGYHHIAQESIISGEPAMGTIVMYEEENDSKNWQFDIENGLIVGEWCNPDFPRRSHLLSHYFISH